MHAMGSNVYKQSHYLLQLKKPHTEQDTENAEIQPEASRGLQSWEEDKMGLCESKMEMITPGVPSGIGVGSNHFWVRGITKASRWEWKWDFEETFLEC